MNGIKSFTIYEEYYGLITLLSEEEQKDIILAILKYMFEDIEPCLNERQMKVFVNLKRPLDISKKNSLRSIGNGAPKGNNNALKKQTKNKPKTNQKDNQKQTHQDVNVNVSNYDNNYVVNVNGNVNVKNKIENKYFESIKVNTIFNEFLDLRKKLKAVNSERAINSLINKLNDYDEDTQYKMIEQSVVNSWKGVFELKENKTKRKDVVLDTLKELYNEEK